MYHFRFARIAAVFCCVAAVWLLCLGRAQAEEQACGMIIQDVTLAVLRDESKIVTIVKEAVIAHEDCAGEIVKAAISALTKKNPAVIDPVVQAAIEAAPRQATAIVDAAANLEGDRGKEALDVVEGEGDGEGDKNAMSVLAKNPEPVPMANWEEGPRVGNIRGVYLVNGGPPGTPTMCNPRRWRNNPTSPCSCGVR